MRFCERKKLVGKSPSYRGYYDYFGYHGYFGQPVVQPRGESSVILLRQTDARHPAPARVIDSRQL